MTLAHYLRQGASQGLKPNAISTLTLHPLS